MAQLGHLERLLRQERHDRLDARKHGGGDVFVPARLGVGHLREEADDGDQGIALVVKRVGRQDSVLGVVEHLIGRVPPNELDRPREEPPGILVAQVRRMVLKDVRGQLEHVVVDDRVVLGHAKDIQDGRKARLHLAKDERLGLVAPRARRAAEAREHVARVGHPVGTSELVLGQGSVML